MGYLLDTNILSEPLRPRPDAGVMGNLDEHQSELATASIVLHELLFGALRLPPSKRRERLLRYAREVVLQLPILDYGQAAAEWHARERARLTALGRTPPLVDSQLAAIAAVNGLTLVTRNVADFAVFDGLEVERWHREPSGEE